MKYAYADPPYLCAAHLYRDRHPDWAVYSLVAGHRALIERLVSQYPDGWVLSLAAPDLLELGHVARAIEPSVRIGAWVKPFASFKPGVNPGYCWEPVLFAGGRKRSRTEPTIRDYVSARIAAQEGLPRSEAARILPVGARPDGLRCWGSVRRSVPRQRRVRSGRGALATGVQVRRRWWAVSSGAMTLDELARAFRWLGLEDVTLKRVKLPDGTHEYHATARQPHTDKTIGSYSETLPTAIVALINAAAPREKE